MQSQFITSLICSVEGCKKLAGDARGMCRMHYNRWHRHGNPNVVLKRGSVAGDPEPRFWAKVKKDPQTGCLLWTGPKKENGYPVFWDGEKQVYAHRWAFEHFVHPIPDGLELDHLCFTPPCVNWEHCEPVSHAENVRRGRKSQQTQCVNGHFYNEVNTHIRKNGTRNCRVCDREAHARKYIRSSLR